MLKTTRFLTLHRVLIAVAVVASFIMAQTPPTFAACGGTTNVSTETELNNAIAAFNGVGSGPCTFTIQLTADIDLTASTTTINNSTAAVELVINGADFTVDGQDTSGVRVLRMSSSTVTINDLTVTRGNKGGGAGIATEDGTLTLNNSHITRNTSTSTTSGGGVYSARGVLHVNNSTFSNNQSGWAGGLFLLNNTTVTIDQSTFSGNMATDEDGGAIDIFGGSTITISNSTFSNNTANVHGGAIQIYADAGITQTVELIHVTISGNNTDFSGEVVDAGAVAAAGPGTGIINMRNSIIADQTGGADCGTPEGGSLVSNNYNLDSDGTCNLTQTNDLPNNSNANLGPLQNNGGDTETRALLAGSDAINAIANGDCSLATDQRGISRPLLANGNCDIGAFEVETASLTIQNEATPEEGTDFEFIASGPSLPPLFDLTWGSPGSAAGKFSVPYGVALDSNGKVYVVDQLNHRVQVFDRQGTFLRQWGSEGSAAGQFDAPFGIAVDSNDNVYVADANNYRVQVFQSDGTFVRQWGSQGNGGGQFDFPASIAVDRNDNIYVADVYNARIQAFESNGTFLRQWGSEGSAAGQFKSPYGVAVDNSDNVYVVDQLNHRIQVFESNGTFLRTWGSQGSGDGEFDTPYGVAVDSNDIVYVADDSNSRIQTFDSQGNFLAKWGSQGSGDGEFDAISDITVDSRGTVYVTDTHNDRVQKFAPLAFTLDDATPDDSDGINQSITYSDLRAGNYTIIEEALPNNWLLNNATCTGSDSGTLTGKTLSVGLAGGETVICTFTNSSSRLMEEVYLPLVVK